MNSNVFIFLFLPVILALYLIFPFRCSERLDLVFLQSLEADPLGPTSVGGLKFNRPPIGISFITSVFLNINDGTLWTDDLSSLEKLIVEWEPDIVLIAYVERNLEYLGRDQ